MIKYLSVFKSKNSQHPNRRQTDIKEFDPNSGGVAMQ
jgi:hypothetical protein